MVNGMVLTISTSHGALLQGGVLLTDEIQLFFPKVILMVWKLKDIDLVDVKILIEIVIEKTSWDWVFAFFISNALFKEQKEGILNVYRLQEVACQ